MRPLKLGPAIVSMAMVGVAAAAGLWAPSARAAAPETVHWQVEADHGYSADVVQFTLTGQTPSGRSSTMSSPASLNTLVGLRASQLQSGTAQPVAFRVQRDAGEFECHGTAQARRASGECRFIGSRSFAQALQQRGVGAAQTSDLYRMSVHDVGTNYLDELHRLNYPTPTVEELARAGEHGVSLQYIKEMSTAYRFEKIDGLIAAHDHGIDPAYVAAMRDAGYPSLSADDLVRLHDHGVSPEFMGGLRRAGYTGLRIDDAVSLRDHGISAEYLTALRAAGYAQLPVDQIFRLHEHGVEPGWLAVLQKAGYGGLPIEQLITLRDQGIDADYIVALQRSGYRALAPADVILLRNHGVDAEFVRAVVVAGYREASPADIAKMRDHGLTPDNLRRAASLRRGLNVDDVIRLRDSGTL